MFEFEKDSFQDDLGEADFTYVGICKLNMDDGTPAIVRDEEKRDIMAPDDNDMYHAIRYSNDGNIPDWFLMTDLEKFFIFSGDKNHDDGNLKVRYTYVRDFSKGEVSACQEKLSEIVAEKINELF